MLLIFLRQNPRHHVFFFEKKQSWKAWKASQPGQLASWASQESQKARKLESIIKLAKWQTSSKLANNWQKCKKTTFENLKIVRVEG